MKKDLGISDSFMAELTGFRIIERRVEEPIGWVQAVLYEKEREIYLNSKWYYWLLWDILPAEEILKRIGKRYILFSSREMEALETFSFNETPPWEPGGINPFDPQRIVSTPIRMWNKGFDLKFQTIA